jgi:hypothetical protein
MTADANEDKSQVVYSFSRIHPRRELPDAEDLEPVDTAPYEQLQLAKLEQRVLTLALAETDIRSAWQMSGMLLERPSARALLDGEREAFVAAIVSTYCRPFMKGNAKLPREWPGFTRSDWQARHDKLLDERRRHIGHSDPDVRRLTLEAGETEDDWKASLTLPWTMAMPFELERTHEMCGDLCNRLRHEYLAVVPVLLRRARATKVILPRTTT